ncbi:MAG: PA0069 family radical SAM protein [Rhodospirillaceae bacterium]|nr:PA0069 family radical SAM protein [Rhodospirillaceae bacterium]
MARLDPEAARSGRGARSNPTGRFEAERRDHPAEHQDWPDPEPPARLRTTLTADTTRAIIARNDSPDVPFDRSINPYRGCEHGCVYCFARPSHAFLGLSPGLDFESRLIYKPQAAALLEAALRKPGYRPATLALGSNTDPYQPVERDLKLTRAVIEVLCRFRHPFAIVTKSDLVLRDLDLIGPAAAAGFAGVSLSVTTLDRRLARALEPRAPTPDKRLAAIARLSAAGVPVAILASPMIPGLTDHELDAILEAGRAAGAAAANTILVRLPGEIAGLFEEWLRAHVPDRADRVLSLIRQCRDGALNHAAFGKRMRGSGAYADLLARRYRTACARLGLNERHWTLRDDLFAVPLATADQPSLF